MATTYIFTSILATIESFSRILIQAQEPLSREQQITAWVSQNTTLVTIIIAALLFYALTKDSFKNNKKNLPQNRSNNTKSNRYSIHREL